MFDNAVLLAASRLGAPAAEPVRAAPANWPYLLHAADRQGVTPLLYVWLKAHPEIDIDAASGHRLQDAYWTNHFRNRQLLEELERVRLAAARAGIEVLPLKGAALAADYYASPALRPLGDLDLLVRPADLAGFAEVLRLLRYREVETPHTYVGDSALDVESRERGWLRDHLGFSALIEYRTAAIEIAFGRLTELDGRITAALREHALAVWARASMPSSPSASPKISPEDLLVQVAAHLAAKHVDFRLIWLHDIARIVAAEPALDWSHVADTINGLRLQSPVGAALEAAACWVGAPIPASVLAEFDAGRRARPGGVLERWDAGRLSGYVASLGTRDLTAEGPAVWPLGSALSRLSGWGPRLRALRWVALPCRAYLADRGMGAATAPGYGRYLAASVRRYTRHLARRSARDATVATKSAVASRPPDLSV